MKANIKSFIFFALLIASSSCQGDFDLAEDRLPDIFESVTSEDQTFVNLNRSEDTWYAFNYNQYLYSRQNFLISY